MSEQIKNRSGILQKLKIKELNAMQVEACDKIVSGSDTVLLSPTGSGKTLAYLLPLIELLDPTCKEVQALIVVPSRELALQIEQVFREMGSGYKANAVYGGRSIAKDRVELEHRPAVLIGTPGRIADHLRREDISSLDIETLVLDEFDKSLEVGFKEEMQEIVFGLRDLKTKILTSATQGVEIPNFVGVENPINLNYLDQSHKSRLVVKLVTSPSKDKLEALAQLLNMLGSNPGIVFCNFKDSIHRVSEYLSQNNIAHGCFYGGMEQKERERSLIKFRNGTYQLLLATDLAARGIDIPELKFIIHYHLPLKSEEFTHRNGRTARMNADGVAYVLKWKQDKLPEFIDQYNPTVIEVKGVKKAVAQTLSKTTLFISGGRKDKISKGDIAGLFFKQGGLVGDELGAIELKHDCAFVSVPTEKVNLLIEKLNNSRLKKKKVRIKTL